MALCESRGVRFRLRSAYGSVRDLQEKIQGFYWKIGPYFGACGISGPLQPRDAGRERTAPEGILRVPPEWARVGARGRLAAGIRPAARVRAAARDRRAPRIQLPAPPPPRGGSLTQPPPRPLRLLRQRQLARPPSTHSHRRPAQP